MCKVLDENCTDNTMMMIEHTKHEEELNERGDIFPNIFSQRTIDELREGVVVEDYPNIVCDCCDQAESDGSDTKVKEESRDAMEDMWSRFQIHSYLIALMKFYLEECKYAPWAYLILFSLFGIMVPIPLSVLISVTLCLSTVVIKFKVIYSNRKLKDSLVIEKGIISKDCHK